MYVLAFGIVLLFGLSGTLPLEAATCTASVATVTKTSSPDFYIDTGLENAYTSFSVATGASGSFTDLWVKADTFTNTSLLGLAPTEDGLYRVGSLASNSTAHVYFYFRGSATATTQSYSIRLYEGKPGAGGSETCSSSQSNTSVSSTISAAANKVNSVNYTAPTLGGDFTLTIIGDTGTIGNSQIFSYTPASLDSWNADCLELKSTQIVLSGGNTGTYYNDLYRSGLNKAASGYTLTYTFNVKCITASNTPVTPVNYISSGNDLKHTDTGSGTYAALPPIAPALNYLLLTKTVSPGGSINGGNVTYSVNIINNGPSSASLDRIKDVLPSSPATVALIASTSTYDSDIADATPAASIANPTISGQTIDWIRTFTVAAGKTARLSYQATIPSSTGSYVNSATAYTGTTKIDTTVDTTDNAPATATYGVGNPSMTSSTKTASDLNGGDLQPGDTIEYTITATATGSNNATGVQITDTIDSDTDSLSGVVIGANSTNCGNTYVNSSTSTVLNITNITILANSSCVVTFQVKVKSGALDGATVLNTASIEPSNAGAISGYPSSTPLIVQKNPILGITINENDADNVVVANQVVTYTTTINNTGQTNANGVDLSSTIAGPVGSLSSRTLTNCGSTYVDTSAGLSVAIASLSITTSASCVITYTVTVNSGAASGSVTNSADITAAREGGSDPAAVSASTLLIGVVATPPSLATTITENDVDNFVDPGQAVTYTATITNSGQTDATTSMTSNIPTGFGTPGSISYLNCGSPSSSFSSGTLSFSSIGVAAGNTCTIQFTSTVNSPLNEGTTLSVGANTAQASQGGNDPDNVNADALTVDATPILATTITENDADNQVIPSQDVTYTITITNSGDGAATGVSLSGTPTGPIGNPGTFSFSNCGVSYTNNSSTSVSITGLSIAAGATCTITYHVMVNADALSDATITQTADASGASEGGSDPLASSATTLIVASLPILAVEISDSDADNTLTPGQTVTYTVTITNSGGVNATTSMALSIPAQMSGPASFTYSSCGSPSDGVTVLSITINASQTCTITFTATASSPLNEGTTLTVAANLAQASQGGNDPANVNADTLTVDATPNLSPSTYTLTDENGDTLKPGDIITYTLTIKNTGDGTATGIDVTGVINSNVTMDTGSISYSNCGTSPTSNSSLNNLSVQSIDVAVGTDCVITFQATLKSPINEGTTITETATINGADQGGVSGTAASNTLSTDATPNMSTSYIETTDVDGGNPKPGDKIAYTIHVINSGDGNGNGINLSSLMSEYLSIATGSFTFENCGDSYSNSSTSGNLSISNLFVSTTAECAIYFEAFLTDPIYEGTEVYFDATISSASEGGPGATPASEKLIIDSTPALGVIIFNDDEDGTVFPGQSVHAHIEIANFGDGKATGVTTHYTYNGDIGDFNSIQFSNCGNEATYETVSGGYDFTDLEITTTSDCIIEFNFDVNSDATGGSSINQTADATAANEGGLKPDIANDLTLTVNADNKAPDIPSNVTTDIFSGGQYLNDSALAGSQLSSDLTDPDDNDQVRYRIQIASDPLFNTVVIDYRSTFSAQGGRTYTYQESSGTYISGSSSTILVDGPYYVQIRNEDILGATSGWYKIDGVAFNYDNTPPVKPEKPFTMGDVKNGTMTIGWDTTEDLSPHPTIPYRLIYSDDPTFTTFDVLDTSDIANVFTSVPLGTYRYFKIIWRDASGNFSEPSDVLAVYMPKADEPIPGVVPPAGTTTPTPSTPTDLPSTRLPVSQPIAQPATNPSQSRTRLTIYVNGANRLPVQNAKVSLSDGRVLYTDEEGVVRFDGLVAGNYNAKVEYSGKETMVPVTIEKGTKEMFINITLPYVKSFNKALFWIPATIPVVYVGLVYRKRRLQAPKRTIHRSIFKAM